MRESLIEQIQALQKEARKLKIIILKSFMDNDWKIFVAIIIIFGFGGLLAFIGEQFHKNRVLECLKAQGNHENPISVEWCEKYM